MFPCVLATLVSAVVSTNSLVDVYSERGLGDLWLLQLTIKEDTADLEFILNNDCGKRRFEFPKRWKIADMDYTVANSTITFLAKANGTQRPEIVEINNFFGDFGQLIPPFNATVMKDGSLYSVILKLITNLKKGERLDMDSEFKEMYDKVHNERPQGVEAMAASGESDTKNANSASTASMLLAAPLALGMLDWLIYL